MPTPTDVPTATATSDPAPPTTDEIASLAQDLHDNQSSVAGRYVLVDVTTVQVQSQDEAQLTTCIAFDFASVSSPDTMAGSDTRLFTLTAASDDTWQVMQMDSAGSCSVG